MMKERDEYRDVWKALSDPTRREILDLLTVKARTTGEVVDQFQISRIAVMKHLAILRNAGLVIGQKRGRERWHYVNFMPLQHCYERWLKPRSGPWTESFTKLTRIVEGDTPHMNALQHPEGIPLAIDVMHEFAIDAPKLKVFDALVADVAAWWGPPHSYENCVDLSIEPRLGGHFVEELQTGGSTLLATVTRLEPDVVLELTGPLHMGLVYSVATFELAEQDSATTIRFSQQAFGRPRPEVVADLDRGWKDLIGFRLKAFVEKGEHHGIK
jgi:DNA-binding transcriptional ArsR family regulator/uncharacterized protein YndB with AHSA1/START domain